MTASRAASGDVGEANDQVVQTASDNNGASKKGGGVFPDGVTLEDYANVDVGVQACGVATDTEIIQATFPQEVTTEDPSVLSGEESEASDELPLVSSTPPNATEVASVLDLAMCHCR
ncbi:hypothetical protein HPB52_021600 [Rhipicephalus sanguineus]|uniref:Uncharacterized protein n=1 Tax=Rhipicephalus sanguineus TaxID=34632 RepID=A0A9D4QCD0_RHISA|nr:hypothetical protein HPB52_021600 [Rhipicephalus sanguineus]